MLRLLPERHGKVLIRRYGLNDSAMQSHEEIGQWLGVGDERSRQIEREAPHRLRSIAAPSARCVAAGAWTALRLGRAIAARGCVLVATRVRVGCVR
jgi:Sigma-70, region 4